MSEKVVNTIIYELGIANSVKETDICAYAYLAKLCESRQIKADDFKIVRNSITGKLELHYINTSGKSVKLSWMLLFHSHISDAEKLRYAMTNSVHNHTIHTDTISLHDTDVNFIADKSPPTRYSVCPSKKYIFKSADSNFRDEWIAYYNLHKKVQCAQCVKTIEQYNDATYGC